MGKGFGIAGFVLGLIGLMFVVISENFGLIAVVISILIGVVALIFSIIQLKREKSGLAVAGLVFSILTIIFGFFTIFAMILVNRLIASFLEH